MNVVDVAVCTEAAPFMGYCDSITPDYSKIIGLNLLNGFLKAVKEMFGNSCLTCHAAIRTNRHQVTYLKAQAIEEAGQKNADVCYGCHGGRSWYRIGYAYPRHSWEGMSPEVPDWAKNRPTESEARFALPASTQQKN